MKGSTATLLSFPRPGVYIGAALKRHRLPEALAAHLARESGRFADAGTTAALTLALNRRIVSAPLNLNRAHAIVLIGPAGSGKSTVAAKIVHAARMMGRRAEHNPAANILTGLCTMAPDTLSVIEAQGFNPLNARAASAFSALGEKPGVETVGVVSALSDAEDVADMVRAFHFKRVIVTNLDRTRRMGALMAAITASASLAHVSTSPSPEDGLQTPGPDSLAHLLLDCPLH